VNHLRCWIEQLNKAFAARVGFCDHALRFLAISGFRDNGRVEDLPEGKDPRDFLFCQCAVGEDFVSACLPKLQAARSELTKSLENPFWL
jgi:hypothetical protein